MSVRTVRRAEGEHGAFIVLWALLVVALMIMVAIVIDLGDARAVRRTNQSVADLSSLAAGDHLSSPVLACTDAFGYVTGNLGDFPTSGVTSPCNVLGSASTAFPTACDGTTPAQNFVATGTGAYTITFRYPVDDSDISDSRFTAATGVDDGTRCDRFKVTVAKTRRSFFAGVVNELVRTTQASAVMRATTLPGNNIPSLWLLDPTGCTSLNASGGAQVSVGEASPPDIIPGSISVDSDGTGPSCSSTKPTIDAAGSGTAIHAVPSSGSDPTKVGNITLFDRGAATCSLNACDPGDVSSGNVAPQPQFGSRATRKPVDWAWNCKSDGNPSPNDANSVYPTYHGVVAIPDCPNAPNNASPSTPVVPQPYIDTLKNYVNAAPATIGGFTRWTTDPGHANSCNPKGVQPALNGNYWIDCPGGFSLSSGDSVTINGNVVFDGPISMTGGSLNINTGNPNATLAPTCAGTPNPQKPGAWSTAPNMDSTCTTSSSANAAWVYMRSGDIKLGGGAMTLNNTMLYQAAGAVKANAGSPTFWHAPTEGPFARLSFWSERSDVYTLNGGGSLDLRGTFFIPEALPFKLTGGGGSSFLAAQFIAYQLEVSGSGTLNLVPNSAFNLSKGETKGVLIR